MRSTPGACDLSVLVATRDRAESLARTLDSLAAQTPLDLDWEILVVDNGSVDETPRVLERFKATLPLIVLSVPSPGKNRALNRALEMACGRLLFFTDDDVIVSPGWLSALATAAERWPAAAIFGGPIEPVFPPDTAAWIRDPDFVLASEAFGARRRSAEGYTDELPFGANLALRASVFDSLRFDEAVGPVAGVSYAQGSEYELLTRLRRRGERIVHVPDAQVAHVILPHQVELEWLFGRAERIGRGSARVKRKRVPRTPVGWIPLFVNLWRARWNAHRARHLAEPERFRIAHRAHYWHGYIAESRVLRGE
jgi:glycosyltransferase involved in cell wall biosynthesis